MVLDMSLCQVLPCSRMHVSRYRKHNLLLWDLRLQLMPCILTRSNQLRTLLNVNNLFKNSVTNTMMTLTYGALHQSFILMMLYLATAYVRILFKGLIYTAKTGTF